MTAPVPLYVTIRGDGPPIVLVHGTAADADMWTMQLAELSGRFCVVAYDRAGTPRSPLSAAVTHYSVADHAADLARVIAGAGEGVVACGSSFGAVVVLELVRTYPELVRAAVLCEPPLAPTDAEAPAPRAFLDTLARTEREQGGPAAAEVFLRAALGDAAFARLPSAWKRRACALHRQIRLDVDALCDYPPRYAELAAVATPVLLLGGDRSSPLFARTLTALEAALPTVRRRTLAGGSHMMHADAVVAFNAAIAEFASEGTVSSTC